MSQAQAQAQATDRTLIERHRAEEAERHCASYRNAFLHMLKEPFHDLDGTIERMLQVLSTTLDVARVSYWSFTDGVSTIRRTHGHPCDAAGTQAPAILHERDFPEYFAAIAKQLTIAADDACADPRTRALGASYLRPMGVTSMLDVPVVAFGRYVGILCHEHIGPMRVWSAEDQNFAAGVATQVALAHERDHLMRAQTALLERSLHDEETHLPNRLHLDKRLAEILGGQASKAGMVVASLDQYDFLVGLLGMRRVRQYMREFSQQLLAAAPGDSFAARIAPNEFALLLPGIEREALPGAIEAWLERLSLPLELEDRKLFITLSAGYSYWEDAMPVECETFCSEARLAADSARAAGGGAAKPFAAELRDTLQARASIEQDLRRALDADEFALHYQPIVHLASGRCVGMEALLRWNHPQLGVVRPDHFMQIAIESGIMLELGRRVIRAACEGLVRLRSRTGMPDLAMSINMSAPEVLLPGTVEALDRELRTAGIPAAAFTIEITESVFILDLVRARQVLEEIRTCGVSVSLDDFGTAFSSLSWLRELPIDSVKIDRAFVAGMERDTRDLAIVKSIVGLAAAFSQRIVAEGIETPGQAKMLRDCGLEYGQGYLFAAPAPIEEIDASWMRRVTGA
jgi:EAL domain-containing protein (putative c-di-GMP-specific phosphodiesterase class I)/GAF domain-containing protein